MQPSSFNKRKLPHYSIHCGKNIFIFIAQSNYQFFSVNNLLSLSSNKLGRIHGEGNQENLLSQTKS